MRHTSALLLLAVTIGLFTGCANSSGDDTQTPPGVAPLPLDWQVAQPGHYASDLVHGLLLTDSATIQAGQPNIKTIAAVDPLTRKLACPPLPGV